MILKDASLGVTLTSATLDHLAAEDQGIADLCRLLACAMPLSWPPEHMDEDFRNWVRKRLVQNPVNETWLNWYVAAPIDGRETLVGCAGFKGPPGENGAVEIGYSIVDCHQRRGFGTVAVRLLCRYAFADPRVQSVTAETLSSLAASISLLKKCGFHQSREIHSEEDGTALRFVLNKS